MELLEYSPNIINQNFWIYGQAIIQMVLAILSISKKIEHFDTVIFWQSWFLWIFFIGIRNSNFGWELFMIRLTLGAVCFVSAGLVLERIDKGRRQNVHK